MVIVGSKSLSIDLNEMRRKVLVKKLEQYSYYHIVMRMKSFSMVFQNYRINNGKNMNSNTFLMEAKKLQVFSFLKWNNKKGTDLENRTFKV